MKKSCLIPGRSARVAVVAVAAAALWGMSPQAAADPRPSFSIFQRRPPPAPRSTGTLFSSARRSEYIASRRAAPTSYYAPAPQLAVASSQPVIVRPPVYTSVAPTNPQPTIDANAAGRTRLVLPVLPRGAPQVPAGESISPAPPEVSIAPAKEHPQTVLKAVPVWPEVPDQPEYGRPIYGRPGFVHPPGILTDPTIVVDVRQFQAGQMVRDPHTGNVFLVPPQL